MRNEKLVAVILLIIALVAMVFTIWDFEWKCQVLTMCFLIVYCGTGTTGLAMLMEATGNAPYMEKKTTNSTQA